MISVAKPKHITPPFGIILYQGPSLIDGKPIVAIATGFRRPSDNPKTGSIIQTWILPANQSPIKSWTSGKDCSVCGNCKHSSTKNGGWNTCYVNVYQAPNNVWFAWKKGNYELPTKMNLNYFRNKTVRIGSYGDPASLPCNVWETIASYAKGTIGYTHNFKGADQNLQKFCMASCDTEKEYIRAKKMGWRAFRVRTPNDRILPNEMVCPASHEGGQKTTCAICGSCCGTSIPNKNKDVSIIIHGRGWKIQRFCEIMRLRKNKKKYSHLI